MSEIYEYTSPQEMRKNFAQIYHKEVRPIMEEFEKIRVRKYREVKIVGLIAAVIWAIVVYKCGWMIFLHALVFIGIIAGIIIGVKVQNFTRLMKDSCMPRFMKAFGNLKHSIGDKIITDDEIGRTKLFKTFNIRRDDDVFVGSYKGVEFKISETYLAYESGSGKNRSTKTRFRGVLIDFKSNKTINNTTIIKPKKSGNGIVRKIVNVIFFLIFFLIFGVGCTVAGFMSGDLTFIIIGITISLILLAILFSKPKQEEILNPMTLEDPEFQKYYTAYSSDEVEGRYLITTAFMARFNDLKDAFGTKRVCCSFYDDRLMFCIWSDKDLFEVGKISKPLTGAKYIEQFYDQMIAILQIIEHFKLNEKTGL